MPSLPWVDTAVADSAHDYLVVVTRFTVTHRIRLPKIVSATQQLWGSLSSADGLIGYSLQIEPLRGALSTMSAWRDQASLRTFTSSTPHAAVVSTTTRWMKDSNFTYWTTPGTDLPPNWHDRNLHT